MKSLKPPFMFNFPEAPMTIGFTIHFTVISLHNSFMFEIQFLMVLNNLFVSNRCAPYTIFGHPEASCWLMFGVCNFNLIQCQILSPLNMRKLNTPKNTHHFQHADPMKTNFYLYQISLCLNKILTEDIGKRASFACL